jgi:hypothetical protein
LRAGRYRRYERHADQRAEEAAARTAVEAAAEHEAERRAARKVTRARLAPKADLRQTVERDLRAAAAAGARRVKAEDEARQWASGFEGFEGVAVYGEAPSEHSASAGSDFGGSEGLEPAFYPAVTHPVKVPPGPAALPPPTLTHAHIHLLTEVAWCRRKLSSICGCTRRTEPACRALRRRRLLRSMTGRSPRSTRRRAPRSSGCSPRWARRPHAHSPTARLPRSLAVHVRHAWSSRRRLTDARRFSPQAARLSPSPPSSPDTPARARTPEALRPTTALARGLPAFTRRALLAQPPALLRLLDGDSSACNSCQRALRLLPARLLLPARTRCWHDADAASRGPGIVGKDALWSAAKVWAVQAGLPPADLLAVKACFDRCAAVHCSQRVPVVRRGTVC